MQSSAKPAFSNSKDQQQFYRELLKKVNRYFRLYGVDKTGHWRMLVKAIIILVSYFALYGVILSGVLANSWWWILAYIGLGAATAVIGLSIMHDANHGSFSRKKWVNKLFGFSMNVVGASAFTWKLQHNVLHHTYTNVHGMDEDIQGRGLFRFSPDSPKRKIHRFQHIYAFLFYAFLTLSWTFSGDFARMKRYKKMGLIAQAKSSYKREMTILVASKVGYMVYILVIPILFTSMAWWQPVVGFVVLHAVAGLVLSLIFQPAHVEESTSFYQPAENNKLPEAWAVHQLLTTSNFAMRSRWFTWLIGGLNYQIEHHLFPHVSHIHYRKLSKIVRRTAADFNLPYNSRRTFVGAVYHHLRLLRHLGRATA